MEGTQRKTESYLQDQESRWRPETRASEIIDGDPRKVGNRFWNIEMFGRQSKQPVRMLKIVWDARYRFEGLESMMKPCSLTVRRR